MGGLVISVLSVSWSSELLLSFSALRNTSTPLLMRTTSSSLTHHQHTLCYWSPLTLILLIWVLVVHGTLLSEGHV